MKTELQLKYAVTLSCLLYLNNERSNHINTDPHQYRILCLYFCIFTGKEIPPHAERVAAFRHHPSPLLALPQIIQQVCAVCVSPYLTYTTQPKVRFLLFLQAVSLLLLPCQGCSIVHRAGVWLLSRPMFTHHNTPVNTVLWMCELHCITVVKWLCCHVVFKCKRYRWRRKAADLCWKSGF